MIANNRLRILLVDDHELFRKGLAALFADRDDLEVVGEAADGLAAVARARELSPDLVLMDVHMPGGDGIDAVKAIKHEMPQTKVVMLTISDDDDDLFAAIKNQADGYLLKNLSPTLLFGHLERIRQGETPLSGSIAARILHELATPDKAKTSARDAKDGLTPRDMEVLELVVQGANNTEIADRLCITENTVKAHLRAILEKLHLANRIQAAVYAVRQGLVTNGPPST